MPGSFLTSEPLLTHVLPPWPQTNFQFLSLCLNEDSEAKTVHSACSARLGIITDHRPIL